MLSEFEKAFSNFY